MGNYSGKEETERNNRTVQERRKNKETREEWFKVGELCGKRCTSRKERCYKCSGL